MPNDKTFANGLFFKKPSPQAPDFVLGRISIKIDEFIDFLRTHQDGEYMNLSVLLSKGGKEYAVIDTWKPNGTVENTQSAAPEGAPPADFDDPIPF